MFIIDRVEPGKLWFAGVPEPVRVPGAASDLAAAGWDITGPYGGVARSMAATQGPVTPLHRPLAQPDLFPDPLTGRVHCQPRQLGWWHVEYEDHAARFEIAVGIDQVAGHPQRFQGPTDVGVARAEKVGGFGAHLHQMPDRR